VKKYFLNFRKSKKKCHKIQHEILKYIQTLQCKQLSTWSNSLSLLKYYTVPGLAWYISPIYIIDIYQIYIWYFCSKISDIFDFYWVFF